MNQTLIKNINIWTMDERDSRFFGWILLENGRITSMLPRYSKLVGD